jgi:hypothetical protein
MVVFNPLYGFSARTKFPRFLPRKDERHKAVGIYGAPECAGAVVFWKYTPQKINRVNIVSQHRISAYATMQSFLPEPMAAMGRCCRKMWFFAWRCGLPTELRRRLLQQSEMH